MMNSVPITREFEDVVLRNCSLLVFRLNEQAFALNIENVVQIIPMLRLTPVPQIDHIIEGIANIHGALVPVINARHHLGLPDLKPGLYTPIILIRVGERQAGWIVDEVTDVISVPLEAIIVPATILPEGMENTPMMSGLVYQGDVSILVLDPRFILRPSQYRKIKRAFPSGMHAAGAQPDPASPPPGPDDDFETLHVPPPNRAALEIVCAALARKQSELQAEKQAQQFDPPSDLKTLTTESAASKPEPPLADTSQAGSEESKADLPAVSEVEQPPEPPTKGRKRSAKRSGEANGKKGPIIPNTSVNSKPEQPLPQALVTEQKGRSIQAALATQFSVLADEVRKTEKQNHTGV